MPEGRGNKICLECACCCSSLAFFMLVAGGVMTGIGFSSDDDFLRTTRIVGVSLLVAGISLTLICLILCVVGHVMRGSDDVILQTNQTTQPIIAGVAPQHPPPNTQPGALGNQMHSYQVTYPAVGYSVAGGVHYPQTGNFDPERQSQMYPPVAMPVEQLPQSVDTMSQASPYSQPSAPPLPHGDGEDQPPSYDKVVSEGFL